VIAHRVNTPDEIVALAGTRKVPELTTRLAEDGLTRERSVRMEQQLTIDPNKVRALDPGMAYLLERHSQQTEIKTFGSAVFWTTTQLLTVSSQIKNPISAGGRMLDVFMEIWAITVVAALAGAFGSFLQKRGQEIDETR
jgi:hypothetical protein